MLKSLRKEVCIANRLLQKMGLAQFTWGNVSAIDRERGLIVIKPSGVPYKDLSAKNMVVVDLDGQVVQGDRPSCDTPTHLALYAGFAEISAVVHTHSHYATAAAQATIALPVLGTTHADCFFGDVPCTRALTDDECANDYEKNTGLVIVEAFEKLNVSPAHVPAVLVAHHGPFAWGTSAADAVKNAAYLESVAQLAASTAAFAKKGSKAVQFPQSLLQTHFLRKHGPDARYGQA